MQHLSGLIELPGLRRMPGISGLCGGPVKVIASCAGDAVSVKSVPDTPMVTDDGLLTEESANNPDKTADSMIKLNLKEIRRAVPIF